MTIDSRYDNFTRLQFDYSDDGIMRVIMNTPGRLNAADADMHRELAEIHPGRVGHAWPSRWGWAGGRLAGRHLDCFGEQPSCAPHLTLLSVGLNTH